MQLNNEKPDLSIRTELAEEPIFKIGDVVYNHEFGWGSANKDKKIMTLIEVWTKQKLLFGFIPISRVNKLLINTTDIIRVEPGVRTKIVCSHITYEIDESYDKFLERMSYYNVPVIRL